MRKTILTISAIFCFFLAIGQTDTSSNQQNNGSSINRNGVPGTPQQPAAPASKPAVAEAYKFILDYQVPTSPAFTLLDVNPEQVTKGSAAKPLVANLTSNFLQTGKLEPGLALDFSPYFLLGGGLKNVKDYQNNFWKRLGANTLLSAATIKNTVNLNDLDHAVAGRITFFDRHDLFNKKNSNLTGRIGAALAKAAPDPVVVVGGVPDDVIGPEPVAVDLSQIYQEAYDEIRDDKGSALSVGFGYKGTALNSELTSGSIINQEYRFWAAFTQYAISKGIDFRSIALGRIGKGLQPEWKAGIALASPNKNSNMGAELVYNFMNKELEYGASFEIRLFKQLVYSVSFSKRSFLTNQTFVEKLRAISTFRYDLFGH